MDDYISREQALNEIHNWKPKDVLDRFDQTTAFSIIYALPSEQMERKKGEWIWNDEMKCFLCSECERGWREQPTLNGKPLFEWCPVCGADMRIEE